MMSNRQLLHWLRLASAFALICIAHAAQAASNELVERLDPNDFKHWLMPEVPPQPDDNKMTAARIELGKQLWFDPRLSGNGQRSCATCHFPAAGWGDGEAFSKGLNGKPLARHTPTIINIGYNSRHSWDGRSPSLEAQIPPVLNNPNVMGVDLEKLLVWMNQEHTYKPAFDKAYPGEKINITTLSKAIATFERSMVSRNSAFDRWVAGDNTALSPSQKRGLVLFMSREKTNCVACHSAPNFMDNGFHNIGLGQFGTENPDVGRYKEKPVAINKGAFKTPTLRDVEYSAPYFHDGSAKTLMDVVMHYAKGGEVRTNLSPNIKPLNLTQSEKEDLVEFMKALSSPMLQLSLPNLPPN
jgi:cytochrome c peroxidase